MPIERVAVVDAEPAILRYLAGQLRSRGLNVTNLTSIAEADRVLRKDQFDLLFVDVRLPDGSGTQLLTRLSNRADRPIVIMMTDYGTIESAVSCIQSGAYDYIIKPFTAGQIDALINKAERYRQAVTVTRALTQQVADQTPLVGESLPVRHLRQLIRRVASSDATVLISGENGTGKELVATEIFRHSSRSGAPFIKVNCAAISDTLIESEFFGHEKGAYTGATERREGRFELAHNGTILLDEISEIPLKLQAKLLRVLQEREFERVGGNRSIHVNVRVLATTNRDLAKSVERHEFRQDLYYRLNVFPIAVPPLRTRKEDIAELVDFFLGRIAQRTGQAGPALTERALAFLTAYEWPGNIRELQNVIERAVILSEPGLPLEVATLLPLFPDHMTGTQLAAPGLALPVFHQSDDLLPLAQIEQNYIEHVLRQTRGNRTKAAKVLGISLRALRYKLNRPQE